MKKSQNVDTAEGQVSFLYHFFFLAEVMNRLAIARMSCLWMANTPKASRAYIAVAKKIL